MIKEKKVHTSLILFLGLLPLIMVLGNSMFFPILPDIQAELDLSSFEISLFLSVFSIPAAILIPFVGILADRLGRKIIVLLSLSAIIFGCIVAIAATIVPGETGFYLLLAGRVLQGIGAGGTAPLAMVLAGDLFRGNKRSETLGILEVFNGLGKVGSPLIGAFAILLFWESTFYFYLIIAVVAAAGLYRFVPADTLHDQQTSMRDYLIKMSFVLRRQFRWIGPIFLGGGAGLFLLFGLLFFLSFELDVMYSVSPIIKGLYLSMPLGTLTIVSYFSGKAVGENVEKMKRFMVAGLLLIFIAFSILLAFRGLVSLLTMISVIGVGLGLFLPAANTAITSSAQKEERGMVVSIYSTIRFLGVAFGPISFSLWMGNVLDLIFYCLFIIGVVMVLLWMSWMSLPLMRKSTNHRFI